MPPHADDEVARLLAEYERLLEALLRAAGPDAARRRALLHDELRRSPYEVPPSLRAAMGEGGRDPLAPTAGALARLATEAAGLPASQRRALEHAVREHLDGRLGARRVSARPPMLDAPPPPPAPAGGFGGGLLSASPDVPPPPPAPAATPAAPETRVINAVLEDHDPAAPLRAGEVYVLAFSVDLERRDDAAGSSAFEYRFADGEAQVVLTVQLTSDDVDLPDAERRLTVPRDGPSRGKARFDIVPRRDGPAAVTATFSKDGNFVQRMTLTFQVGAGGAGGVATAVVGRPLDAAQLLRARDAGICVEPAPAGGFHCTVWGAVCARAHLPITAPELADAIDGVRRALLDDVIKRRDATGRLPFQQALDVPAAERDAALGALARAGFLLYQRLFYHPAADAQARRVGDWLRAQTLRPDAVLRLQVVGQGFPVPWALLYVDERWDPARLDWDRFLGMRHVVEQLPLQQEMRVADGTIATDRPDLCVGVNLNEGIDAQMRADFVARQKDYWGRAAAARARVRVTTRTTPDAVLDALRSGDTGDQLLYLYCHATAAPLGAPGGVYASSLELAPGRKLTLSDLVLDAPPTVPLRGAPLVFINACESAELSPLFYDGFVPYFMARGARGVVGTECQTPALFAAEWAPRFFDRLLDGGRLGDVVLELRREFLREHNNPLGLVYAVHCDGDTLVDPALRAAA